MTSDVLLYISTVGNIETKKRASSVTIDQIVIVALIVKIVKSISCVSTISSNIVFHGYECGL